MDRNKLVINYINPIAFIIITTKISQILAKIAET